MEATAGSEPDRGPVSNAIKSGFVSHARPACVRLEAGVNAVRWLLR